MKPMNMVLICNKKFRKQYEPIIRKTKGVILLGTETIIRNGFINKILEDYNPHSVMITHDVIIKDNIDIMDTIALLKMKRPSLRVIYYQGEITDKKSFKIASEFLLMNKITDIIVNKKTDDELGYILQNPMTKEDYISQFKKSEDKNLAQTQAKEETINFSEIKDNLENEINTFSPVELDRLSLSIHDYDILEVVTINEKVQELVTIQNIAIGIASILPRCGCTHTAFEIANFLMQKYKSVCVVISDDKTYQNLVEFYGIDKELAKEGFEIKSLDIFPMSKCKDIQNEFNYIIYDIGCLDIEMQKQCFVDCHIKLMLCSCAEWNIMTLMNYLNSSENNFSREINYCFYPVSQSKFISLKKRLSKGKYNSYRLVTSSSWDQPDVKNKKIYQDIIKGYTSIDTKNFKSKKPIVDKAKKKVKKKLKKNEKKKTK